MRDVLAVIPSRGRPARLSEALDAALSLSETALDIAIGYDDDDPAAPGYEALAPRDRVTWHRGPRDTCSGWTNRLAAGEYRAFFSMSDDHLPRTQGWDRLLLEAIDGMGGTGFAYGDDLGQRENLSTSVMVSADIVRALGWFMLPACAHYHVDNAWMDLGRGAGCLAWCPGVVIEHAHPFWGLAPMDATYEAEFARGGADMAAYQAWVTGGRDGDVATITALAAARKES